MSIWILPALITAAAIALVMTIDYLFADLNDQGEPEDCDQ